MAIPVRALGEDERVLLVVRPHGRVLVGPVLVVLLLLPVVTVFLSGLQPVGFGRFLRVVVVLVVATGVIRGALLPFLAWWRTVYVLTTERLVLVRGSALLRRRYRRAVDLDDVTRVSFSTGPYDRFLGCGRLRVDVAGAAGPLVLDDVPSVLRIQEAVSRAAGLDAAPVDDPVGADDGPDDPADQDDAATGPGTAALDVPTDVIDLDALDERAAGPRLLRPDAAAAGGAGDPGRARGPVGEDDRPGADEDLWPRPSEGEGDDVTWRRRGRGWGRRG